MRHGVLLRVLLGLVLSAAAVGCGGAVHGHWTDPGARLVSGMWIGPVTACPPERDECAAISAGARGALPWAEREQVAQVQWVSLPTQFVTDGGEQRTPRLRVGILIRAAALVTFDDGREWAVGLNCYFPFSSNGVLNKSDARCWPATLTDWQDGAVPPSFPPGTVFG